MVMGVVSTIITTHEWNIPKMSGKGGKRISVFDRLGPGNDEDVHVSIQFRFYYNSTNSTFKHPRLALLIDEFRLTKPQKRDTQSVGAQGSQPFFFFL